MNHHESITSFIKKNFLDGKREFRDFPFMLLKVRREATKKMDSSEEEE